jgi:hypothetical protein
MAFRFIPLRGAIDEERNIVVRQSSQFYDDLIDRIHFVCRWGDMSLEFTAVCQSENVPEGEAGRDLRLFQAWATAYHIDELSLRHSLAEKLGPGKFDESSYISVRDSIRDGLFILITEGGAYRGVSPDLVIDFLDRKR